MSKVYDDYYAVLGVDPTADKKEIRKAYLRLSLQYHPDKNPENPQAAQAVFVKIGQAYQVLSDPAQRAAYDRYRRTTAASSASGSASGGRPGGGVPYSDFTPNDSSGYASTTTQQSQQQQYETYREAFDATMAGLSEDELRDVMGAAAMIGSLVGSIVGSRMLRNHPLLRDVGSVVGSLMASHAATAVVQTAHQQSVQRAAIDQDRRERIARGEPVPEQNQHSISVEQAWKGVERSFKQATAEIMANLKSPAHHNKP
jgi:DnaJ domain